MIVTNKTATIFGGTGFIGTQIVRELAALGMRIKIATRIPESAYETRVNGTVGQIVPIQCDYNNPESITKAIKGSDLVVNCIGILYERKKQTFEHVHIRIPEMIANACKEYNVSDFIHISALGCKKGTSKYAQSKYKGEQAIHKTFPDAVILRPSIVFGENDEFFNMFAKMIKILPPFVPLPLIGGGQTKFQPVFVGDVADAVVKIIRTSKTKSEIYELGGPDTLTFKDIYQKIFQYIGQKQPLIKTPFCLAKFQAFFLQMLPKPLLTPDQVESLKTDNIVNKNTSTFAELKITTTSMDLILPKYLERYRVGGRFSDIDTENTK